jgi:hypothetical protein
MILHTTHWSRDGKLHQGTVESCESCHRRAALADPVPDPLGPDDHAPHQC